MPRTKQTTGAPAAPAPASTAPHERIAELEREMKDRLASRDQEVADLNRELDEKIRTIGERDQQIADLNGEIARLGADKSGMETEIHNQRQRIDELQGLVGQANRQVAQQRDQIERSRTERAPTFPAVFFALKKGQEYDGPESLDERLCETPEEWEALQDEGRVTGRRWVGNHALLQQS